MLDPGEAAPEFSLPGTDGEQTRGYELAAHTGSGVAVLAFYPFDFSPVCTTELCAFRDSELLTLTPDVDVLAISSDSVYSHRAFIDANRLTFPLLSDNDAAVASQYGVRYDEWEAHPNVPMRAVFVVDDDRTVRFSWVADDAYENPDLDDVHAAVTSALDSTSHGPRS